MKHALLGASKAHRWMTCPGSISLESTFPEQESFYAAEGTAAHALAEESVSYTHLTLPTTPYV